MTAQTKGNFRVEEPQNPFWLSCNSHEWNPERQPTGMLRNYKIRATLSFSSNSALIIATGLHLPPKQTQELKCSFRSGASLHRRKPVGRTCRVLGSFIGRAMLHDIDEWLTTTSSTPLGSGRSGYHGAIHLDTARQTTSQSQTAPPACVRSADHSATAMRISGRMLTVAAQKEPKKACGTPPSSQENPRRGQDFSLIHLRR